MPRLGTMRRALVLAAALVVPGVLGSGCTGHVRIYDSYASDYHPWDRYEDGYYKRWEIEIRSPHIDYRRRRAEEQRRYWEWRHAQHEEREHHH